MYLAWFHWDPSTDFVVLPFIGLPLTWYGLLFATGFWVGFHIFVFMFKKFLTQNPKFVKGDVNWKEFVKLQDKRIDSLEIDNIDSCNALLDKNFDHEMESFQGKKAKYINDCIDICGTDVAKKLRNRFFLESQYPKIFTPLKIRARDFAEKIILYVIIATILGARLGHVFFYEHPMEYLANPLSILKTWEGGLASHGGILAVIFSLWLFYRNSKKIYPNFSWFMLLDTIAIPTMLVASLIRIGNFFNQEILGVETVMPWGIIFGHPADGGDLVPRHPAQLYESLFYLMVFFSLMSLWKKYSNFWQPGRFAGIAILSAFSFRFFVEFIKTGQSHWFDHSGSMLFMGQWLSLPLVIIGAFLIFRKATQTIAE